MRLKYGIYVLLLFLLTLSLATYLRIGSVEEKILREKSELERSLRDVRLKRDKLRKLRTKISEEGLQRYGEFEALELLLGYVEELKKDFDVKVVREVSKEGNIWRMDLKLGLKPRSGSELSHRVGALLSSKAPVVFLRGIYIDTQENVAELIVSLEQPFVGEKK